MVGRCGQRGDGKHPIACGRRRLVKVGMRGPRLANIETRPPRLGHDEPRPKHHSSAPSSWQPSASV